MDNYSVYKHTFPDGKVYIGISINPKTRWSRGHGYKNNKIMDKEIIEDWLKDIATPTGVSYSGDQTISESMVEEIVDYVEELEQQVKGQKEVIDKAINWTIKYQTEWCQEDEVIRDLKRLLDILKGNDNNGR